jgi:pyruvate kinase
VANLVLDGADGIVLGSETFRGKFAAAAAETVLAICQQVRGRSCRVTRSAVAANTGSVAWVIELHAPGLVVGAHVCVCVCVCVCHNVCGVCSAVLKFGILA